MNEIISVAASFQYSVNIEYDLKNFAGDNQRHGDKS